MKQDNKQFTYSYSAAEQSELRRICSRYTPAQPREQTPLDRIRALDTSVTRRASALAITLGILSALVMGIGMSLVMTDLPSLLGVEAYLPAGIVTGLVGMAGVILSYPVYRAVLAHFRRRAAPEILRLSSMITNE